MRIAISNIADKFKLKFKRLLYNLGPEVKLARRSRSRRWRGNLARVTSGESTQPVIILVKNLGDNVFGVIVCSLDT